MKKKLYQAYYEPDHLWTCGKAIKKLHKITSMSKKDIKSWLAKQTFGEFIYHLQKKYIIFIKM